MFFDDLICIRCGRPAQRNWQFDECPHCLKDGISANYAAKITLPGPDAPFIQAQEPGIFKYRSLYAIKPETVPVSIEEGNTPLIHLKALGQAYELPSLFAKDETRNPTWSHKDRLTALGVTKAREVGAKCLIVSSTGNQGISAAAYAAKAGLPIITLTGTTSPQAMKTLMQAFGAMVFELPTSAERVRLVEICVREFGLFPLTGFGERSKGANPYAIDGYKSLAIEMVDQLGGVPDKVVFSVAGGDSLVGTWRGFLDLYQMQRIKTLPQMIACEPLGSMKKTLDADSEIPLAVPARDTIAFAVGGTSCMYQALQAVRQSGGTAVEVKDRDTVAEQMRLAREEGIFLEPSSALALAGVRQLAEEGRISKTDKVVTVLTSTGLKEFASAARELPPPIVPTGEALVESLRRHYGFALARH